MVAWEKKQPYLIKRTKISSRLDHIESRDEITSILYYSTLLNTVLNQCSIYCGIDITESILPSLVHMSVLSTDILCFLICSN